LKILSIGSDKNLFKKDSRVAERIIEYGKLVEELHIVVFTKKSMGFERKQISENVWIYPTNSFNRWVYPFDAAKLGKQIVYENKFVRGSSLITTQDPFESGWAGLKIKKRWRLPLEVQLHTDPFSAQFYGALNLIRKVIANRVIRKADRIRVVNEKLKTQIVDYYNIENDKISVLPIFVDKEKFENGKIEFDLHSKYGWHFVILMVTRLTPEKNIFFALDVLKKVVEKFPSAGLVVLGSGPLEDLLKKYAENIGVTKNVSFEPWQDNLYSYFHTANMYLQTSKFEGYGLSLIEAGVSGLPIVTTNVGFAEELINGKDVYIGNQGDSEYFKDAILDLIENNQARENLKINMKNTLEKKLISKEEYLKQILEGWQKTAKKI
jgi:glycosyltransferase involved in cell wall biosynthesis